MPNYDADKCTEILEEIRTRHDTTKLTADEFEGLAMAIAFYAPTHSITDAARLAAEEYFPA
jgi:hypothetical protein